jgi:hypothetical protein
MENIETFKTHSVRKLSKETIEVMGSVDKNISKLVQDIIYGPILDSSSEILIWNLLRRVSNIKRQ